MEQPHYIHHYKYTYSITFSFCLRKVYIQELYIQFSVYDAEDIFLFKCFEMCIHIIAEGMGIEMGGREFKVFFYFFFIIRINRVIFYCNTIILIICIINIINFVYIVLYLIIVYVILKIS